MKNVLIPTDLSENAITALEYAMELYNGQVAKFHLLTVVNPDIVNPELPVSTIDLSDAEYKNALAALSKIKKDFTDNDKTKNIAITSEVKLGGTVHCIRKMAAEIEADIIVMGTRGSNHNYLDKILGTISTETIKDSPCPVLLIPIDYKFAPLHNLLYASQLNHSDPYELWRACEILKPNISQIRCLFVNQRNEVNSSNEIKVFSNYMIEHSPSLQTIFETVESDNIGENIEEYASEHGTEIIIMHKSKKSFWTNMFSKSNTIGIINSMDRPLLVMN